MHEHVFGQKDPYTESKGVCPRGLSTTEEGGGSHSFRNMNTVPFA